MAPKIRNLLRRTSSDFSGNQSHASQSALAPSLEDCAARSAELAHQVEALRAELEAMNARMAAFGEGPPFVPNGHFYSPIPSMEELRRDYNRIYSSSLDWVADIDLRESQQLEFLKVLGDLAQDITFPRNSGDFRYGYANDAFGLGEAAILSAMLRHLRPERLIEIGSGHSSCVTLDTNERWLGNSLECTFIEPYPQRLYSLLRPDDLGRISILEKRVQDVELSVFSQLRENDVLFIDSTHVSKIGSDVNRIYFDVLPWISEGVFIHIHDVFFPFEYPPSWTVDEARAWNEQYILRALLQNNSAYEIVFFQDFLIKHHGEAVERHFPSARRSTGSIWLRKR